MLRVVFMAIILTAFISCEKVIDLDLGANTSKLVIEGNITNGAGPYFVTLSKSVPFDESSVYPAITNAFVVISDDAGITDTLTHVSNGRYTTNRLVGIEGRTYQLRVEAEGKTYNAFSKMPRLVQLDSLRYSPIQFNGERRSAVVPVYTDPTSLGDNYRFILSINGVVDENYFQWNDNTNNGNVNARPVFSRNARIVSGDRLSIEMQSVDETAYLYHYALSQLAGNGPGGGTTPSNPPNNISGGALGLFSAHTLQTKTIVAP